MVGCAERILFLAFTSFNAPQSNLAEVIHAGWKNRDKMGVSLLECCYFDLRDSILLSINLTSLENGGHDSGFGPSDATRRARNASREVEHASQLGRDLLDFSVASPSSSSEPAKRKMSGSANVGCNPPKRSKNTAKMFNSRFETAKVLEQTMKIRKVVKVSDLKQEFDVLSTESGRVTYKVIICNVPSCTCPDYKNNGMVVSCKHIIFIFLFVLKVDEETISNAPHIGDEDVKALLSIVQVEERFMKRTPPSERPDVRKLLGEHELFGQQQTYTLHHKASRSAKCTGCKKILQVGTLAVRVNGALTVPYGKNKAVEQVFYFCAQKHCFTKVPIWCNVKMPSQDEVNQF